MDIAKTTNTRLARVREFMRENQLDAVIVQKNANLRWLTSAANTFDDELAHTAYITQNTQALRTDSRYLQTFKERLGTQNMWELDGGVGASAPATHATWLADQIAQSHAQTIGIEDNVSLAYFDELLEAIDKQNLEVQIVHIHEALDDMRIVKDEEELEALRQAQRITDAGLAHILEYIKVGMTEAEVARELDYYMLCQGASEVSFKTILASGPNGALPHAQPSDRKLCLGDLVVIDFGALKDEYHADMTRTVAIGAPTERQLEVYEVVRHAHEQARDAVRPGVCGADIHNIAAKVIKDAGYGRYFSHGLGHGVGLEIHENPGFRPSWNRPIPKNSVVTIEPGIYLPGEFGIRLEDTGVVSEAGFQPFTSFNHDLLVAGV